ISVVSVPFAKGTTTSARVLVGKLPCALLFQSPSRRGQLLRPLMNAVRELRDATFQSPSRRGQLLRRYLRARRRGTKPSFQSPSRRGQLLRHTGPMSVPEHGPCFSPLREGDNYFGPMPFRYCDTLIGVSVPFAKGTTTSAIERIPGTLTGITFQSPSRRGQLLRPSEPPIPL